MLTQTPLIFTIVIDRFKEVLSAGDDYALVLNRDEDGLESVQFYRFSMRNRDD